ncbi:MAG: NAD(P)H-dependent oxidoreductase [Betaproteobacteria bacterium]|nr:MAG: NAD(P)H-dependent oxidoreductase [Betaproteobacteria bacterium]
MQILGICGSLRKASFNMAALRACPELMPPGMTLHIASLGDIPACPEYNFSLTAALKNAIDWASRPPNQAFQDKPAAMFSCTPGPLGGARVQYDLRRILVQLWSYPLPRPEVFIGMAPSKFDAQGKLTDETTRKFLADLLVGFKDWIARMQKK